MSCFNGRLKEYEFLSIDRFDGKNLYSWAYFLSHCHSDHMVGLDSPELRDRFNTHPEIQLYCSEVTKALLQADDRYSHLVKHITALPLEHEKIINIKTCNEKTTSIAVTQLPASHCPGSVMFLFEGQEDTVLYTGDFRLPKGSAKRLQNLHTADGSKKHIKSLYIDTTFCIPDAVFIPGREDCLTKLEQIVDEWLSNGTSHAVRLNISAKYGYEYLFHALNKKFGMKIYCRRKKLYQCLPDTYKIITDNEAESKIFACFKKERISKPSQWNVVEGEEKIGGKYKFRTLTLSTLYFTYSAQPHEICQQVGKNHFRFCFSFHSSYSEVCDFVKYIHPDNVYANVKPRNGMTLKDVEEKLSLDCSLESKNSENIEFKSFGKMKLPVSLKYDNCSTNVHKISRKRALSLSSTDDDDSQEISQKSNWKVTTNGSKPPVKVLRSDIKTVEHTIALNDDICTVNSSPESKIPSTSEVEDIQIKIALSQGLLY